MFIAYEQEGGGYRGTFSSTSRVIDSDEDLPVQKPVKTKRATKKGEKNQNQINNFFYHFLKNRAQNQAHRARQAPNQKIL